MTRKILSVVAVTGLVFALAGSKATAQTGYPYPSQTQVYVPPAPATVTGPTVVVSPPVIYRPAVGVYVNPLPPAVVYRPYPYYGGYGYPYYGGFYGHYRWRR